MSTSVALLNKAHRAFYCRNRKTLFDEKVSVRNIDCEVKLAVLNLREHFSLFLLDVVSDCFYQVGKFSFKVNWQTPS